MTAAVSGIRSVGAFCRSRGRCGGVLAEPAADFASSPALDTAQQAMCWAAYGLTAC